MLEHLGPERIDLGQRHSHQIDGAASVGAIGQRLVIAPALVGSLGLADQVQHGPVEVIFVARSSGCRAGGHVVTMMFPCFERRILRSRREARRLMIRLNWQDWLYIAAILGAVALIVWLMI